MTPVRLLAQVGLRVAEKAIRLERANWIRELSLQAPGPHLGCPVCKADLLGCRCDHVRAWLILRAARIGRRPNR